MHVIELWCRAVDMKLENVGAVVVAGEVVPQFHLDGEFQIAIGVNNSFFRPHRPGDDSAHRIDNQTPPQQSGFLRNFSPSGPTLSISIIRSSTVPQAEITKALLICAKACESMATRCVEDLR